MDWSSTAPKRTMKPPFQDLSGDPNPGDYGTGPQGEEVKKYEVSGAGSQGRAVGWQGPRGA
jgi:hypothetical protein